MTNTKIFGPALVTKLTNELAAQHRQETEREARISQCEVEWTDCFLSIAANQATQKLINAKLQILKDRGVHEFIALVDQNGRDTGAKRVRTRFGGAWNLNGQFLGKRAYRAMGFDEQYIAKPAWCKIGATSRTDWFVEYFPTPDGFNYWTGTTNNSVD